MTLTGASRFCDRDNLKSAAQVGQSAQERVATRIPIEPHAMPPSSTDPIDNVRSPIPATSAAATTMRLTGEVKSIFASIQIRTPRSPISPYRTSVAPPRTPSGTVNTSAPNFGEKASTTAVSAATQYAAVEYTRVAAMTPMFSRRWWCPIHRLRGNGGRQSVGEQGVTGDVVEVPTRHRGDCLDVAHILGDQDDDHGQRQQHDGQFEGRRS